MSRGLLLGVACIALLCCVQALTDRERQFLSCIVKQTSLPQYRDRQPNDLCYAKCYSSNTNLPAPYSTREYASGAHVFLNHELFRLRGLRGYDAQDWHGERLDPNRGILMDEMREWAEQYRTGFFAFRTTRGKSVSNPDHEISNLKHAQLTHSIRVTIRIKNVPHRAAILWLVILDMCETFMPEWFKIDTPGAEREDSMIMMFHESENPKLHPEIRHLNVHQRLERTYLTILEHIETASIELKGEAIALRDVLEHGSALPPFQYQKDGDAYASVADYFYGASFGSTLCKHMTHRWSEESGFRQQIMLSLEDETQGVVALWKQRLHPTAEAWGFEDPQDQNFAIELAKDDVGEDDENPSYQVQHLSVNKFVQFMKSLGRLEEDVQDLIAAH